MKEGTDLALLLVTTDSHTFVMDIVTCFLSCKQFYTWERKQPQLDKDIHARIKNVNGKKFSDVIDRLTLNWSLVQWVQSYERDSKRCVPHRETLYKFNGIDNEEVVKLFE